jgi:NAD(P)-dependent dehydrogenase (short-subunit alcohol dehydrogenase family)
VFQQKTCFITGGARGLGLGIARQLAGRGALLAIADRDAEALVAAHRELEQHTDVRTYQLDVRDRPAFLAVADQVEQDLGPVHALFNNAGVVDSVSPSQMRGELWDWMVDVNLNGVYNGVQAFVPRMIARGDGGIVVNVSSVAGILPGGSGFAYHATKFAVVGMTLSLRHELDHHGIRVSVVCPGQVATAIVRNTADQRPAEVEAHTDQVTKAFDAAHESLQSNGVSIDDAGRSVVEGVLAGQPFVFTDGLYRTYIEQYTAQILSCMPETDPSPVDAHQHLAGKGT